MKHVNGFLSFISQLPVDVSHSEAVWEILEEKNLSTWWKISSEAWVSEVGVGRRS